MTVTVRRLSRGALMTASVPQSYLQNAVSIRLALLQGLLDADSGLVTSDGRIQFSAPSPHLRDDVVFLVRSLGGVVHRSDAYVVDIRLPEGLEPFRLQRKRDKYRAHTGGRPTRFIDRIEPAGEADTVCISVSAADSLYVTEDFLVTHNTLNDAFIVLDEAQNTTPEQMKMFLTRIGFGSKAVVTGDVSQVDLPGGTASGLKVVRDILRGIDGVAFSILDAADVVRHPIVQRIVEAYERHDADRRQDG
jgi:phosphate starvation-inducible protein PhoH and related proteins